MASGIIIMRILEELTYGCGYVGDLLSTKKVDGSCSNVKLCHYTTFKTACSGAAFFASDKLLVFRKL